MTSLDASPTFAHYRAPRQHGAAIIAPPLGDAQRLLRENRSRAESWEGDFAGLSLVELRQRGRDHLVSAALRYTNSYRSYSGKSDPRGPLILAGHQPELFHPGVWFKNFSLSELGEQLSATVVNLVVDNDLRGAPAVQVPAQDSDGRVRLASVPLDGPGQAIPYEQHRVTDRALFESFPRRLGQAIKPFVQQPCVHELWPHALRAANRCDNTGCALAQGRHALEAELDLQTLELPLSVACRSPWFAAFVLGLVGQLPRFHDCYNRSVREYRLAHGIRSNAHPVPELKESDEWLEAPLWIYGDRQPERRPAWVRMHAGGLELSDREGRSVRIETAPDRPEAAEELYTKCSADFKLRPRALLTTMYARLVLSDLFLHGIGGGKYDQLGDQIVRRFFGFDPPSFMVLSATALLPGARQADSATTARALRQRIRDSHFHPESFAADLHLSPSLLDEKRKLLAEIPERGRKQGWHNRLTEVNGRLSEQLREQRDLLWRQLKEAEERQRQQQVLSSREHPFCVFPLGYLNETFGRILRAT